MWEWMILSVALASGQQHRIDVGPLPPGVCTALIKTLPVSAVHSPVGIMRADCLVKEQR